MLIEADEFLDELEDRVTVKGLYATGRWDMKEERRKHTGRVIRSALKFMRFMFMSGRNKRTRPESCRYAFMPSKMVWA